MRLLNWLGDLFDRITGFKRPEENPADRLEAIRRYYDRRENDAVLEGWDIVTGQNKNEE